MKQIVMNGIPSKDKKYEQLIDYLKSLAWQFHMDDSDKVELILGENETTHMTELEWPLRKTLVQEQLPIFLQVGNGRLVLYKA